MSKPRGNTTPADMSLPPEDRHRKRRQRVVGGTPPAQMDHASSPRARRLSRDGQRWLAAQAELYIALRGPGDPPDPQRKLEGLSD